MLEIAASEVQDKIISLLDQVEKGEQVLIRRDGRTVARLMPNNNEIKISQADQEQAAAAMQRIRNRAVKLGLKFDWEELKRDRDEGRP